MSAFRPGHVVAIGAYSLLVIVIGIVFNLGALVTVFVVVLPIAILVAFLAMSRRTSSSSGKEYDTAGATTKATIASPLPPDRIKEIIKANVRGDQRFELVQEDPNGLLIQAGLSIFTWGEDIAVRIQQNGSGTRVDAECQHKQRTAIADFGQSRRDLQKVLRGLDTSSG